MTSAESRLPVLLQSMEPILADGEWVFATLPHDSSYEHLHPLAMMREQEGISVVISAATARQHDVAFEQTYRLISLTVHSSLEAVGLTAAIATALAKAGLSANVIAGHYHDHLLVRTSAAQRALAVLGDLSASTDYDCNA